MDWVVFLNSLSVISLSFIINNPCRYSISRKRETLYLPENL